MTVPFGGVRWLAALNGWLARGIQARFSTSEVAGHVNFRVAEPPCHQLRTIAQRKLATMSDICSYHGAMGALEMTITVAVKRAPDWLRRDLLSEDRVARSAAEEALAAIIANALAAEKKST